MIITKTNFMRGMQCPKLLWLDKHRPELKNIPSRVQAKLDAETSFGDLAMGMFGPYEEMTVLKPGTTVPDKAAMLEKTRDALKRGVEVICEAAFYNYNNYCAADIVRKIDNRYNLYEVKDSRMVYDQFVKDVGFQYFVISRCLINIDKIFIVIHGTDPENPCVPVDVTEQAKGYYNWINDNVWRLARVACESEEVQCGIGRQCLKPYECRYYGYCSRF